MSARGKPPHPSPADGSPCSCAARETAAPAYLRCCGRWHRPDSPTHLQAPDAELLMRSRYSAFVLGLNDYLLATWHPSTRPLRLDPHEPGLKWLGLEVQAHHATDASQATVRFVARSKLGGRAHRLQETSRFIRETDGRWYYLDGDLAT